VIYFDAADKIRVSGDVMARTLFSDLSKSQIEKIYGSGVMRNVKKGEIVFRKGDEGSELFVVINGKVAIIDDYHGKKKVIAELGPGECFGEMALFSRVKRSATVLCHEAGTLLVVDEGKLQYLVEKKIPAKFLVNLIAILASRLRHTNAHYMKAKYGSEAQSVLGPESPRAEKNLDKEWIG